VDLSKGAKLNLSLRCESECKRGGEFIRPLEGSGIHLRGGFTEAPATLHPPILSPVEQCLFAVIGMDG
jgi:hypothetical protein